MKYKKIALLVFLAATFWGISAATVTKANVDNWVGQGGDLLIKDPTFIYRPNVRIPGDSDFSKRQVIIRGENPNIIGEYIKAIYDFGARAGSVLAVFMLVLAGWKWLMAAGNAQKITAAKEMITSTLIGLALLLGGWLILSQISSNLVSFDAISLPAVEVKETDDTKCAAYYDDISELMGIERSWADASGNAALQAALAEEYNTLVEQIDQKYDPSFAVPPVGTGGVDPANYGLICGNSTTVKSDINPADRRITCIANLCDDDGKACVIQGSIQLCPDSATVYGEIDTCRCVPSAFKDPENCTVLFTTNSENKDCDNRNDRHNDGYKDIQSCMQNTCYQAGSSAPGTTGRSCGVRLSDQQKKDVECKNLSDVGCSSNAECNVDGSNEYCCEQQSSLGMGWLNADECKKRSETDNCYPD